MTIREQREALEKQQLSPYATLAVHSRGRLHEEEPCPIRTAFARDRDRIIHCKAFRRLKYKTQVFLAPLGDHYHTRMTHTLEVAQIARTIARALRLNEDLTEAIALGHDLGHTPFGHAGERALDAIHPGGFAHHRQSLRVVDRLENGGKGLNLTFEVRNGILNHTSGQMPVTSEGCIVRVADRIAYLNHDIDDALRGGILTDEEVPWETRYILGRTHSERINTLVSDTVENSTQGKIAMSSTVEKAFIALRQFMFEYVYTDAVAKSEESKAEYILTQLYQYFLSHTDGLHSEYRQICEQDGNHLAVCDYIAGMTDRFAVQVYHDLFIPRAWSK
ncbi:MAG TPA: deoxyguanosinetriphosphate triphosphohydrolase [Ruminococcaceae bacterium]|nr:deoxyguanosinetriphosphate triphosphohydrolase [Oscillospiraceae bacterium]